MGGTVKRVVVTVGALVALGLTTGCIPIDYQWQNMPVTGTNENWGISPYRTFTFVPPDGSGYGVLRIKVPCFASGNNMAVAADGSFQPLPYATQHTTCSAGVNTGWFDAGLVTTGQTFVILIEDIGAEYPAGRVQANVEVRSAPDGGGTVYQSF